MLRKSMASLLTIPNSITKRITTPPFTNNTTFKYNQQQTQQQGTLSQMSSSNLPSCCVAFVTIDKEENAKKLSSILLEKKLCACVNIIPKITSMYWWDGKIQEDGELLLVIKTKKDLTKELIETVKQNHPYSCPEVITTDISEGSETYLQWIREQTKQ